MNNFFEDNNEYIDSETIFDEDEFDEYSTNMNEKTIIDELIESISADIDLREGKNNVNNKIETKQKAKNSKEKNQDNNRNKRNKYNPKKIIVKEYQIMMNCDQSDYIIYLKKC